MKEVKIGIFGLGHLGKIHLKCLKMTSFKIVGFHDPDSNTKTLVEQDIPYFSDEDALIQASDAIDIVAPTIEHYRLIVKALRAGKHVFVEKPICYDLNEVKEIKKLIKPNQVLQVGHVERFNPAFIPLKKMKLSPMFIEGHRIAKFNPRGTDVSVVLDLMIHDLDIVCALVNSEIEEVAASGVSIVSDSPDIANARITFQNGCVANLTASRISMKEMRKIRLFANNSYISIDFLEKKLDVISIEDKDSNDDFQEGYELDTKSGSKFVQLAQPEVKVNNAIFEELKAFYESISNGKKVEVGINEAYKALGLAVEIMKQITFKEEKYTNPS